MGKIFHFTSTTLIAVASVVGVQAGDKNDEEDCCIECTDICVTSPRYDCDYDCTEFFVNLDYTYWLAQPGQVGTLYDIGLFLQSPEVEVSKSLLYPKYKMRSGFKLGAGTYIDRESLQIYGQYTLFYNKQDRNDYINRPHINWNYAYSVTKNFYANVFNRLDLVLRRELCLGKQLTATPAAGLLFGADEQWIGGILMQPRQGTNVTDDIKIDNHQKWWGIGPYFSVNSEAYLLCDDNPMNFAFIFSAGSALPWSKYRWKNFVTFPNMTGGGNQGGTNVANTLWALSPLVEMSIGLKWETLWGTDHQRFFSIKAAWENQMWLSHTYISTDQQPLSKAKNYIMQGLTVSGTIDF